MYIHRVILAREGKLSLLKAIFGDPDTGTAVRTPKALQEKISPIQFDNMFG